MLRAKTIVFTLMDTLFVDTRRSWYMLSSELGSVRSFKTLSVSQQRIRSCSIACERRSAISIHGFLHRCQTNLHEKFQRREFHTTKEKVFTKACALPNCFYSLPAHCNAHAASCYGKSMAMAATMNKV